MLQLHLWTQQPVGSPFFLRELYWTVFYKCVSKPLATEHRCTDLLEVNWLILIYIFSEDYLSWFTTCCILINDVERCLILVLPADRLSVFDGWLHIVAVTISRSPFLPGFAAGLHKLLGRHYNETQTPSSRFIPLPGIPWNNGCSVTWAATGRRSFTIQHTH